MGYVLLLGVWIFPQCNYDMLILPPHCTSHDRNKAFQLFRRHRVGWSDIWMNRCVGFHTCGAQKTWVHQLLWGRGSEAQMELVAVFPEMGSDAGQATLNSSAGFIVSGVDRVRPHSSPQHKYIVSIRHGADTMSTDKPLSRSSRDNPAGIRGHMLKGASLWHDLNTDRFSWVCVKGGRPLPGDGREGSSHLPLPHVAGCSAGMCYKGRGKTLWVTTCLAPLLSCVPQRVCVFTFPETRQ